MRAGGIEWDWWHPLERFIPAERRLFSLLLVISIAVHGVGVALVRTGWGERAQATAAAVDVVVLPSGDGGQSRAGRAMRFDLLYADPSAVAMPRLASLFSHAALPTLAVPVSGPAPPKFFAVAREFLPSGAMPPEELAAGLLRRRPVLAHAAPALPDAPPTPGAVTFGSAVAQRLVSPGPRLDPVVRDQPLEGPTVLSIAVDAEGGVRDAIVAGSCGSADFDERALALAWRMRFLPVEARGTVWSSAAFHWPQAPGRAGRSSAP